MTTTEQISADLTFVVNHVLRDEQGLYAVQNGAPDQAHARLACRVAERKLSHPQEAAEVMGWVLNHMQWTARHRALSNDEVLLYAAAIRVSEFISMLDTIALLWRAIEAKDWDAARECWLALAPWHSLVIGASPDAAYFNVILQDLTPTAIH